MRARDSPRCLCNQRAQEDGSTERESAARRSQPTPAGRRGTYIQYIVGGRACQRARRGTPRPWPQLAAATADPRRRPWRRPPRQGGELGVAGRGSGAAAYPPPASPRHDCPTARCHPPPPWPPAAQKPLPHPATAPIPSSCPHTQPPPPTPRAAAPPPGRRRACRPPAAAGARGGGGARPPVRPPIAPQLARRSAALSLVFLLLAPPFVDGAHPYGPAGVSHTGRDPPQEEEKGGRTRGGRRFPSCCPPPTQRRPHPPPPPRRAPAAVE